MAPHVTPVSQNFTVGFTPADWEELQRLQGRLGKIRFGPRQVRAEPIQLSFLPQLERPKRPKRRDDDPGYERYQLRLW